MTDLLLRELYWRHTKETVKGEYQIPECVEDLVLMDFDEIESVLYADARDEGSGHHVLLHPIANACKQEPNLVFAALFCTTWAWTTD